MKTVQEYLISFENEALIRAFFSYHPIQLMFVLKKGPISTIYASEERSMHEFLDYLKALAPIRTNKLIFVGYKSRTSLFSEIGTALVDRDEINSDQVEHYGWMTMERAELMGCLVADNEFTQRYIVEILCNILEETIRLGYTDGDFHAALDRINKSLQEAEKDVSEGRAISTDELYSELGIERPIEDPVQKELEKVLIQAESAIVRYSYEKELGLLRKALVKEEKNHEDCTVCKAE